MRIPSARILCSASIIALAMFPAPAFAHCPSMTRGPCMRARLTLESGERPVVYDLAGDPTERQPDPAPLQARSAELLERLRRREVELAQRAAPASQYQPLDDETKEKLRRLGYLR